MYDLYIILSIFWPSRFWPSRFRREPCTCFCEWRRLWIWKKFVPKLIALARLNKFHPSVTIMLHGYLFLTFIQVSVVLTHFIFPTIDLTCCILHNYNIHFRSPVHCVLIRLFECNCRQQPVFNIFNFHFFFWVSVHNSFCISYTRRCLGVKKLHTRIPIVLLKHKVSISCLRFNII